MGFVSTNIRRVRSVLGQMSGADGKVALAGIGTLAASIAGTGIRFAIQVALANWMGAVEFGRFVTGRGWGELLAKVPNRGYELTAVRYLPMYEEERDWGRYKGFVRLSQLETLILGCGLGAFAAAAYATLADHPDGAIIAGMLIIPALSGVFMGRALLQGAHQVVTSMTLLDVVMPLLLAGLIGGTFVVVGEVSAEVALLILAGTMASIAFVETVLVRRNLPEQARRASSIFDRHLWVSTARTMFVAQLAIAVLTVADVLIVSAVVGRAEAGLYAVATRIAVLGRLVNSGLESVVSGRIARAHSLGDTPAVQRSVDETIRLSTLPTIGFALFAIVAADPILSLFGAEYVAARPVLVILLIGNVTNALTGPSGYVVSMGSHERAYAAIMSVNAVALVGLGVMAASIWGIEGVAWVQAGVTVSWNLALVWVARNRQGVSCYPRRSLLTMR